MKVHALPLLVLLAAAFIGACGGQQQNLEPNTTTSAGKTSSAQTASEPSSADSPDKFGTICERLEVQPRECKCWRKGLQNDGLYDSFVGGSTGLFAYEVQMPLAACKQNPHSYPKWYVERYVEGCVSDGNGYTREECKCRIERWQKIHSYQEHLRIITENDRIPDEITAELAPCKVDQYQYPKSAIEAFVTDCTRWGEEPGDCRCGIENHQRVQRYEDYLRHSARNDNAQADAIIAVAACRTDQHNYPKYILDHAIATCMANGQERDECECEIKQVQRTARYVEYQQHALLRGQYPPASTVARAKCAKNQHHYPKWGAKAVIETCLNGGGTQKECECEVVARQKLERFEDYVRRLLEGSRTPQAVAVAIAQCKEDQHNYPARVVEAYVEACMQQGNTHGKCVCQIQHIQRALPYSDFMGSRPHSELLKTAAVTCSGL